jgi:hypothetical protein
MKSVYRRIPRRLASSLLICVFLIAETLETIVTITTINLRQSP